MDEEHMSIAAFQALAEPAMAASLALHLTIGVALGIAYFSALWWNARLFATGLRAGTAIVLITGRLVLLSGLLALAALQGAVPLLATAFGVLLARSLVLRRYRGSMS